MYTNDVKIVEFIGYPGSGKSYISTFVSEDFSKNKGLKILSIEDLRNSLLNTKFKKFFWYAKFFILNFFKKTFFTTFLEIVFCRKSARHLKYYIDIYGSYSLIKKNKNFDYYIISEGFVSFATYLFSNVDDEQTRRNKCEKYLIRHFKYIQSLFAVIQIFNPSEEKTLIHTSKKRNVDISVIKKKIKKDDFIQTSTDHAKNLCWCEAHSIHTGAIENNYESDSAISSQLENILFRY